MTLRRPDGPTPTMIATPGFWRDLAVRAVRNAVQVTLPVLALAASGRIDSAGVLAVAAAAFLAAVLSAVKTVSGLTLDPGAPDWQQAAERALAAAAGAVAGLLPLSLNDAIVADWRSIGVAACGAAGLALATWVLRGTGGEGEHEAP